MSDSNLQRTALHPLHLKLGAKMVPFAGYDMPVQYPLGVKKEHLHTREAAGLFDVSHMGQIRLVGDNIAQELEKILPQDVLGLAEGRQRYGLMLNAEGGIRDDLMFANRGDDFLLVVNAACKAADAAWLRQQLPSSISVDLLDDKALIALQGPEARRVLSRLAPSTADMRFMDTGFASVAGIDCWLSCSGYTGEDGYEISVGNDQAQALAEALLAEPEVEAIGLGARDSLRLEAGLCLYGHDMDSSRSPVEAGLLWAIQKCRRPGGERAGGYIGADLIARQLEDGVAETRVLLDVEGRAPVREHTIIVDEGGQRLGEVCSGGFGPSTGAPLAMAYLSADAVAQQSALFAEVRGRRIPVAIRTGSFVPQRYYRG